MSETPNEFAERRPPGPSDTEDFWLDTAEHHAWLADDALRQFDFFRASVDPSGGFYVLDADGTPRSDSIRELHATTRMIHSYALGKLAGVNDCDETIDHGMRYLWQHHRDQNHGGYLWALDGDGIQSGRKLAYGHVFVLLAASSAKLAGHPDAQRLLDDICAVLEEHFWDEPFGLFREEFERDWTPFSQYRGMNANMHGIEALLAAYEATGRELFLDRAGRILDVFVHTIAPNHRWRLPEHYDADWRVDEDYSGDPMFRPAGTTPGHSLEFARLTLHHWDLAGRPDNGAPHNARKLVERALGDGWDQSRGGLIYTLDYDGKPAVPDRYWWPVTEAIGALAAFIKLERRAEDELWYRRMWEFADAHFVDHIHGGWHPQIDDAGQPGGRQFVGKPDIYHAIQATLFPLAPGLSRLSGHPIA